MVASLGVSHWSSSVVGYSPDSYDVSTEPEESPRSRSFAREQLVKADYEVLAFAPVISKVWRLTTPFSLLVITICKWSINRKTNLYPVYSHPYM
jgi:hypothetical protein